MSFNEEGLKLLRDHVQRNALYYSMDILQHFEAIKKHGFSTSLDYERDLRTAQIEDRYHGLAPDEAFLQGSSPIATFRCKGEASSKIPDRLDAIGRTSRTTDFSWLLKKGTQNVFDIAKSLHEMHTIKCVVCGQLHNFPRYDQ
jgi:hypothetical protein